MKNSDILKYVIKYCFVFVAFSIVLSLGTSLLSSKSDIGVIAGIFAVVLDLVGAGLIIKADISNN